MFYKKVKSQIIKSLPCAKACASTLRKGKLLAQGTCARNSRKLSRKQLAQANCLYVSIPVCIVQGSRKARARLAQATRNPKRLAQASRAYHVSMKRCTYQWMSVLSMLEDAKPCARTLRKGTRARISRKDLAQTLAQAPCASKLAQALDFLTFFIKHSIYMYVCMCVCIYA